MSSAGNLLILGDLEGIGQGHRAFRLITQLFDRMASNSVQWERLWSPKSV